MQQRKHRRQHRRSAWLAAALTPGSRRYTVPSRTLTPPMPPRGLYRLYVAPPSAPHVVQNYVALCRLLEAERDPAWRAIYEESWPEVATAYMAYLLKTQEKESA